MILYAPYLISLEVREGEGFFHHEVRDITRTVPLNGEARQAEPTGVLGTVSGKTYRYTLSRSLRTPTTSARLTTVRTATMLQRTAAALMER